MTPEEAVHTLDAIDTGDPEQAHYDAEQALLALVPQEVRDAYRRVVERSKWWAYA